MIPLRSSITKKLLAYFYLNPQESLYLNEIARKLRVDKRNLVKKINELEQEGFFNQQQRGNLKLYTLNSHYPLYEEYKKIILKTIGIEDKLKTIIQEVPNLQEIYIYGSYASNTMQAYSDIDLLAIGEHDIILLQKKLNQLQKDIGREINIINMAEPEFKTRIKRNDPFITGILKKEYIKITP